MPACIYGQHLVGCLVSNQHRAWLQSVAAVRGGAFTEKHCRIQCGLAGPIRLQDDGAAVEEQLRSAGAVELRSQARTVMPRLISGCGESLQQSLGSVAFIAERNAVLSGPGAFFGAGFYGRDDTMICL
jgi:hypothetical protein